MEIDFLPYSLRSSPQKVIFYRGSPSFSDGGIPKSMSPYWDFRIADFNPKSRADSPTAMNIKTAIFPLLRLLLRVK